MVKLEKNIWNFVEKHKFIIFLIIVTILSIVIRINLYNYSYGDYELFLKPWFDELKDNGGLKALGLKIGNYNAPYMTILAMLTYLPVDSLISIKTVSIIFDYVCAIVGLLISLHLFKDNKRLAFLIYSGILFLPTVFLNSACWGQADSIYAAFILISILCLFKEKYTAAFIFCGIAFSFKLQTIFILPLYILMYLSERKFSIFKFLWIVVAFIVMCMPSIIFGNSLSNCINTYIGQVGTYKEYITLNFPNFYGIFWGSSGEHLIYLTNELLPSIGIVFTMFIFVIVAYLVIDKKIKFDSRAIIEFALWSLLICTFFLPRMHERYLFVGDVLALLYLIYNKNKWYIAIGIELVSLYGYLYYLFSGFALEIQVVSIFYFVLFALYSKDMYKRYFENNNDAKA